MPQLPNQDIAGDDLLAAEPLHAAALAVGITPVAAGALTFLMCHDDTSLRMVSGIPESRTFRTAAVGQN